MDYAKLEGTIWFNGQFVPWQEAKIHVLTHTLHYGTGVFEGVRAYHGKNGTAIFRLNDHTKRFHNSAKIVQMKLPYDVETLNEVQLEVVRKNKLKDAYIRPFAFYGSDGMGLRAKGLSVNVAIATWQWGAYLGEDKLTKGVAVRVSSHTRHHVNAQFTRAKVTGNYVNSSMALHEALACGADEALLLDAQGYVTEGSGENFFMVKDGVLYTPTLTSCLDGITRRTIMQFAQDLGVPVIERLLTRDDVYTADEAFFTGTAAEVTPIASIDGRAMGIGDWPITKKLQALYFSTVKGEQPEYQNWLSAV